MWASCGVGGVFCMSGLSPHCIMIMSSGIGVASSVTFWCCSVGEIVITGVGCVGTVCVCVGIGLG